MTLSKDSGKILENVTCIELLRRKSVDSSLEIYYWKDYQQNEVDFVVKQGPKIKTLIQVCQNLSENETKEREINALIKASKELKCKNLVIINRDKDGEERFLGEKIKF